MTGTTHSLRHRRAASLLAAGAVGALLLTGATACASTSKSVGVSAGSSYSGSAAATSASPSASATASASASASGGATAPATGSTGSGTNTGTATVNPGGITDSPNDQFTTAPAGSKYTPFSSAAHSADGRTVYLGIESQGGACGKYDVVVQESSSSVSLGLIHVSAGTQMCPMYIAHMLIPAKLSAPLDGRRVIDLANGQTVASAQIG